MENKKRNLFGVLRDLKTTFWLVSFMEFMERWAWGIYFVRSERSTLSGNLFFTSSYRQLLSRTYNG